MTQETVTYLTNIVIITILACLITHYWLRQGRTPAMRWWMISAWVMLAADVLFAARPELPQWLGRTLPTLFVTVGHAGLYFGACRTAGLSANARGVGAMLITHAAGLVYFLTLTHHSDWRMVFNGVIWAAVSFASYQAMHSASLVFWKPLVAPANAFLLHGIFHCLRVALAILFAALGWTDAAAWLQMVGDLEVSFFMVALFVGILLANLHLRNEELTSALAEVQTLSGLLPICSWCKKVRDDDGYWQRVEDYFAARSQIEFTHGICEDCYKKHDPRNLRVSS